MKEQITKLQNKHKRYIELMSVMNNAVKNMNNSFNDYEKVELSVQNCIDIVNALNNETNLIMCEIRDKLEILRQESENALKFVENFKENVV